MRLTLNTATPVDGEYSTIWHFLMIEGAGPFITVLQGAVFFLIMMRTGAVWLFPFLFLPFFMRAIAFLASFFWPNDEARIALKFALPFWSLPLFVTCLLALFAVLIVRERNIDMISISVLTVVSFVAALTIVFVDGLIFF